MCGLCAANGMVPLTNPGQFQRHVFFAVVSGEVGLCMEVYYEEICRGKVNFEVSVHDTHDREKAGLSPANFTPPFFVFLTARDETSRTIWSTPVMSEKGT